MGLKKLYEAGNKQVGGTKHFGFGEVRTLYKYEPVVGGGGEKGYQEMRVMTKQNLLWSEMLPMSYNKELFWPKMVLQPLTTVTFLDSKAVFQTYLLIYNIYIWTYLSTYRVLGLCSQVCDDTIHWKWAMIWEIGQHFSIWGNLCIG